MNQIKLPLLMDVPLKFDTFDVGDEQGGGVTGQVRLAGEKTIGMVLKPASVALPDSVNVPLGKLRGFVSVALKVWLALAIKGPVVPDTVIGEPDDGVAVMLKLIV